MPSPIFISRPPPGFSVLAVIRGMQLTILGGYRALKNPDLAKSKYYRQAVKALILSLIVQVAIWSPIVTAKWILRIMGHLRGNRYSDDIESSLANLRFWQNALNVGPLLISGMRFLSRKEMDDLFMMSLQFVDKVYKSKHPETDRAYYPPLKQYDVEKPIPASQAPPAYNSSTSDKFDLFIRKYAQRALTTIAVYTLSGVPVIGRFVLPVMSFYSFNQVVGTPVAATVFGVSLFAPRRWMMLFLSAFWGGRSLSRELLNPYFKRIPFSRVEKDQWFTAREGIMFGFGAGFYLLLRIPFIGVLVYGFAEASSAYLITKVSDPPPHPSKLGSWTEGQTIWTTDRKVISGSDLQNDGF
jgi:hypothetical protein